MKIVSLDSLPVGTTSHAKAGLKQQMVGSHVIPHIHQFPRVSFKPTEIVAEHKHEDMYEVMFIEEGQGIFKIDGVDYEVKKGDCVTVEPKELHEVRVTGKSNLTLLVIGILV